MTKQKKAGEKKLKAEVYVTLKPSVLDPQGKAVKHAIATSGMYELKDVRVGKYIELDLGNIASNDAETKVKEMCEKLLANTVIEQYKYKLIP